MIRVLLYGEVDLNLIDGSSVWLASVAEMLSGDPEIDVTVLQRTRLTRDVVVAGVQGRPNVHLVDPWAEPDPRIAEVIAGNGAPRLRADIAAEVLAALDAAEPFTALLVRGEDVVTHLLERPGIGERMWCYLTDPLRHRGAGGGDVVRAIASQARGLLCQTEEAASAFTELVGTGIPLGIVPPMIPRVTGEPRRDPHDDTPKLCYSGKFSPPYLILETLDAFSGIRNRLPDAEFWVVGDKFHNTPPRPGFVEDVTHRLESDPGVRWHGGRSRADAAGLLSEVDIAASWRDPDLDASLELSTKVLEYAGLGLPALISPSAVQVRVFGSDYPGFVRTEDDFTGAFLSLVSDPTGYRQVSGQLRDVAAGYTFDEVRRSLVPLLVGDADGGRRGP